MRCPYCGNENVVQNRFCGMCGRPLLVEAAQAGSNASPNAPGGTGAVHAANPETREERHANSAGSLLGTELGQRAPEPSPAYTGGLFHLGSSDDRHPRDLDYLLEDDERPRSWGGLFIAMLLAAALAGGIGWLRWRNGGLPAVTSAITDLTHESSGAKSTPEQSPSPDHGSAESTSPPQAPLAASQAPAASAPTTSASAPNSSASETPGITPVVPESPAAEHATTPTHEGKPTGIEEAVPAPHGEPSPPPTPAAAPASTPPAAAPVPKPEPHPPAPAKPAAASSAPAAKAAPAVKQDPVTLGEKYLYGRGVPQSCEKGLHLVKPAADQDNSKAMITMGALYATGHCVGRDLPTAYRFFALALRKDPDNAALKQNAEMVWGQMTPTERQHAIQLTQ